MNDYINGLFEFGAAIFILNHCRILYNDKKVKGVSILSTIFFFFWGLWNIYYYPSLNQSISFYAGIAVAIANFIWIILMLHYKLMEKNEKEIEFKIDQIASIIRKSKKKKHKK